MQFSLKRQIIFQMYIKMDFQNDIIPICDINYVGRYNWISKRLYRPMSDKGRNNPLINNIYLGFSNDVR